MCDRMLQYALAHQPTSIYDRDIIPTRFSAHIYICREQSSSPTQSQVIPQHQTPRSQNISPVQFGPLRCSTKIAERKSGSLEPAALSIYSYRRLRVLSGAGIGPLRRSTKNVKLNRRYLAGGHSSDSGFTITVPRFGPF